ncbi:MAG: hypothetical protein JST85_21865 [Acidobacteria bacterium]|nr:hypothetical protein [Acidobacteriota bacterium]
MRKKEALQDVLWIKTQHQGSKARRIKESGETEAIAFHKLPLSRCPFDPLR